MHMHVHMHMHMHMHMHVHVHVQVVPLFADDDEGEKIGEYDADAQIHAGWLLAHAGAHAGGGLTQVLYT